MATYGLQAPAWLPVDTRIGSLRLTRRGRVVRAWTLALAIATLVIAGVQVASDGMGLASGTTEVPPTAVTAIAAEVVVEQGDSLWAIALEHAAGRDPREVVLRLRQFNGLSSNLIQPGQVILVPDMV